MRRTFFTATVLAILVAFPGGATLQANGLSFSEGLKLYHEGRFEKAFSVFRDLHRHQPSGTGKFQYFMALSANREGLPHEALMDLEGALRTNPDASFTHNPAHVRTLHARLMREIQEGQSPVPPPHPVDFAIAPPSGSSSHILPLLALFLVGGVLLFLALRRFSQKKEGVSLHDKTEMEETAGRLMKAVDKLIEDKNYYLLDHPQKKEEVEKAFHALDPAYRNVLTILREPESPDTNWTDRRNRFEEALAPVDHAILAIRSTLGESPEPGLSHEPAGGAVHSEAEGEPVPGASPTATVGGDRCVFCGRDAKEGRTVPLERQGKVAYARACPSCLAEMDQHYQQTGTYQPPASFFSGGMPYMGGGLSFGDLMLLDWMTHEGHGDSQPVSMPETHSQGGWDGGGNGDREDRDAGGSHGGGDRS